MMKHLRERGRRGRRGSALLEFTLVGIPILFISTSIMSASLDMWQFHNLAYGTQMTARYAAMHGRSCTQNGNACTVTVGDLSTYFEGQALALDPSKLNLKLQSLSETIHCDPLDTCKSSTTMFPNAADNGVKFDIVVTATYPVTNPIAMFWPGVGSVMPATFNLFATSRQMIVF
jgi:Flp pilus assembly protein TadG